MKINILAFGQVAEAIKAENLVLDNVESTDELLKLLKIKFPQLQSMEYKLAVNKQMIHGNTILSNEDTIALLPPFSGG